MLFQIDLAGAEFRAFDVPAGWVTVDATLLREVLPDIAARSVWTAEKRGRFAVTARGRGEAVTDGVDAVDGSDGVDGATGETVFVRLGPWEHLGRE